MCAGESHGGQSGFLMVGPGLWRDKACPNIVIVGKKGAYERVA